MQSGQVSPSCLAFGYLPETVYPGGTTNFADSFFPCFENFGLLFQRKIVLLISGKAEII